MPITYHAINGKNVGNRYTVDFTSYVETVIHNVMIRSLRQEPLRIGQTALSANLTASTTGYGRLTGHGFAHNTVHDLINRLAFGVVTVTTGNTFDPSASFATKMATLRNLLDEAESLASLEGLMVTTAGGSGGPTMVRVLEAQVDLMRLLGDYSAAAEHIANVAGREEADVPYYSVLWDNTTYYVDRMVVSGVLTTLQDYSHWTNHVDKKLVLGPDLPAPPEIGQNNAHTFTLDAIFHQLLPLLNRVSGIDLIKNIPAIRTIIMDHVKKTQVQNDVSMPLGVHKALRAIAGVRAVQDLGPYFFAAQLVLEKAVVTRFASPISGMPSKSQHDAASLLHWLEKLRNLRVPKELGALGLLPIRLRASETNELISIFPAEWMVVNNTGTALALLDSIITQIIPVLADERIMAIYEEGCNLMKATKITTVKDADHFGAKAISVIDRTSQLEGNSSSIEELAHTMVFGPQFNGTQSAIRTLITMTDFSLPPHIVHRPYAYSELNYADDYYDWVYNLTSYVRTGRHDEAAYSLSLAPLIDVRVKLAHLQRALQPWSRPYRNLVPHAFCNIFNRPELMGTANAGSANSLVMMPSLIPSSNIEMERLGAVYHVYQDQVVASAATPIQLPEADYIGTGTTPEKETFIAICNWFELSHLAVWTALTTPGGLAALPRIIEMVLSFNPTSRVLSIRHWAFMTGPEDFGNEEVFTCLFIPEIIEDRLAITLAPIPAVGAPTGRAATNWQTVEDAIPIFSFADFILANNQFRLRDANTISDFDRLAG